MQNSAQALAKASKPRHGAAMVAASGPAAKVAALADPPEAMALLAWYDRAHRRLPWRAEPGALADPYRVWLSEIMLQQTTVQAVRPYFEKFVTRWPGVEALALAPTDDVMAAWAGLGYYSRARNLLACARQVVADHGGRFPADEQELRGLPGIGAYTSAAIVAIAFGKRAVVVDGNVERVIARYFAIEAPLPGAKPTIRGGADRLTPKHRPGDFAQALMDLGATICTPKKPACALCPLMDGCAARHRGIAEGLPAKPPKSARPVQRGAAFVIRDGAGRLLVRTRQEKGLLGGMTEVPGTPWVVDAPPATAAAGAPLPGNYTFSGSITHIFTHIALELAVFTAIVPHGTPAADGMRWLAATDIATAAFPTVMRKVLARAETAR